MPRRPSRPCTSRAPTAGCALPLLAQGQQDLFTGGYVTETWDGVGHYPHLEQPDRTAARVITWLQTPTDHDLR